MSVVAFDSPAPEDVSPPVAVTSSPAVPRVWTIFAAWFAAAVVGNCVVIGYIAFLGAGVAIATGVYGLKGADMQSVITEVFQNPLTAVLLSFVPFQLGMALVVLNAARRSPIAFRERVGLLPQSGRKVGGLTIATAGCFTVAAALVCSIGMSLLSAKPVTSSVGTALQNSSWISLTMISLILSTLPAIVEEVLFRGYIQRRLLQRWWPTAAIAMSTLMFAVLHMDSLQHIVSVIPLGLVTGLLAYRTNSIYPGMIVHGVHNAAAVGFATLIRVLTPQLTEDGLGMMIVGVISMLGLIGLPAIIGLCLRPRMTMVTAPMMSPQMRSAIG